MTVVTDLAAKLRIRSRTARCFLSELIGTAVFLYGAFASSAQATLTRNQLSDYNGSAFGWGLSLMFAIYMTANISGGHLNPAVSFMFLLLGKLPLAEFFVYVVGQCVGAFLGASLVYLQYYDMLEAFDGGARAVTGPSATAAIFATYPHENLSFSGAFIDEMLTTMIFCLCIATVTDGKNRIPAFWQPALIGSAFAMLCMAFGLNTGTAVNPARDFMPRLMTLCVGYGTEVFSHWSFNWFWIPIVCPLLGAVIAAWIHALFLATNIDDDDFDKEPIAFVSNGNNNAHLVTGGHSLNIPVQISRN